MSPNERVTLIAQYQAGPVVIAAALDGITESELDTAEAPGEWTPRQVIHHLADSETRSAIRLKRLLAEDVPEIVGYDQDQYAQLLHYDRPIATSLALFNAVRASTRELIDQLTDTDWERAGTHTESGTYTMIDWLQIYGVHAHEHADQITRARAAARKAESGG